jgi:hypothetical protein
VPDTTWLFLRLEYSIKAGFVKGFFGNLSPCPLPLFILLREGGISKGGGFAPSLLFLPKKGGSIPLLPTPG